jgi:hypothetical protein
LPGIHCGLVVDLFVSSGKYGTRPNMTSAGCSGLATEGFWTSEGSTTPTQFQCGSPNFYCEHADDCFA